MIGIIPAGGEGSRWGGIPKMLLPYHVGGKKWSFIDYTIDSMARAGADKFVIIASRDTIGPLTRHLGERVGNVFYTLSEGGMWQAIRAALPLVQDEDCLFGMPDTCHDRTIFKRMVDRYKKVPVDFVMGTFYTDKPERFGTLLKGRLFTEVVDKIGGPPSEAWGTLLWSSAVSHLWTKNQPMSYTAAINLALRTVGWDRVLMDYYYDMASFSDYERLICER